MQSLLMQTYFFQTLPSKFWGLSFPLRNLMKQFFILTPNFNSTSNLKLIKLLSVKILILMYLTGLFDFYCVSLFDTYQMTISL